MYFEVNSWMLSLLVRSTSGSDDDGLSAMRSVLESSYGTGCFYRVLFYVH